MKIRDFEIGAGRTFVIAETCSNIIGHLDRLETIVRDVAWTGADALKVQIFSHKFFPENERESKRRLEFPRDRFPELVELCHKHGLACGASVFDGDAVELVAEYGDFIKIATREFRNHSLNDYIRQIDMPTIFSFDMRDDKSRGGFFETNPHLRWLPMCCTPEYPCEKPLIYQNMDTRGYSSHTSHWIDCLIAVSRGTWVVEKHIGFHYNDSEMGWSLEPQAFKKMVAEIRWVESCR